MKGTGGVVVVGGGVAACLPLCNAFFLAVKTFVLK